MFQTKRKTLKLAEKYTKVRGRNKSLPAELKVAYDVRLLYDV